MLMLGLLVGTASAKAQEETPLSLQNAIEVMLEKNFDIQIILLLLTKISLNLHPNF